MDHLFCESGRPHVHDLLLILRTTHSLMADHTQYINDGRSLRILNLALLDAIADLEQIEESPLETRAGP
jgi:hypothetical protein